MAIADTLQKLWDWGHFQSPANAGGESWNITREDLGKIRLDHPAVKEAIRSYQDFNALPLEEIAFAKHNRPAIHDGELGPATKKLIATPRCGFPDYSPDVEAAIGSGSWPANCLPDWKDTHALTISVNTSGLSAATIKVLNDQVWPAFQKAYSEIGMMLIRKDGDSRANLQTSFVQSSPGWIGLAEVPNRQTCSMSVWNRLKAPYFASAPLTEKVTLWLHEVGHNMGMGHSRGGIMNAYIVTGLAPTWIGDPSFPTLKRWFGGVPVTNAPPGPEMITHYGFKTNRGREIWLTQHPPTILGA